MQRVAFVALPNGLVYGYDDQRKCAAVVCEFRDYRETHHATDTQTRTAFASIAGSATRSHVARSLLSYAWNRAGRRLRAGSLHHLRPHPATQTWPVSVP